MTQDTMAADAERLRLGGATYVWKGGQLRDACGDTVALRAKSLKMFAALLSERGAVLSKDRLSELVWPNTVATDESIARCIADIRKALDDHGHEIVETFPKQGYRLNVVEAGEEPGAPAVPWRPVALIVGALCAMLLAALTLLPGTGADVPAPAGSATERIAGTELRDAVAILPFSLGAEGDRFLAAGLSDDLEIHLAEVSGIRIVSQAQSVASAGGAPSPVALARSLGARYIVHGSVRQSGEDIALSLQLIDGSDGATLWADRFEGQRDGLMTFREALPEALVEAMSIDLNARDRERLALRDTADPLAFEEVMHARRQLSLFTYEGSLAAERHLRRAIARDPGYARAHAELAAAFAIRMENDWIVLSRADTDKAFYFAEKALELDPDLWFTHYTLGRLHSVSPEGDIDLALEHLRRAMALQPANEDARMYFAIVNMMTGRLAESLRIIESVMATHPEPPFWYHLGLANVLFHLHRYEEAAGAVAQCLAQMPNSPYCLRLQIAVLARLGRSEDAAWAVEEYAILGHDLSLDDLMKAAIERDEGMRAHLRDAYGLAGLQ